jgi:carboxymethylenebutenolidase
MGRQIELTVSDGHRLGGYRAEPPGAPIGAIVVIQEIFGVNNHIRSVCDRFADLGYVAVAPALFDRHKRDFQSGYSPEEVQRARAFLSEVDWDAMMRDVEAAVDSVRSVGPVAVVGFCMGGSLAFLAAPRIDNIAAAIGYYGGRGSGHPAHRRRSGQGKAAGLRGPRLRGRRPRLPLRRAGKLPP